MLVDSPAATLGVVLSNTVVVRSNPWLGSWLDASRAAGLDVREISLRGVLARGADAPLGAHLQWPERALNPHSARLAARNLARLLLVCAILRLRRARVLLTAHNVTSHDQRHRLLERLLWAALPWLVTDVHDFTAAGRPEVQARHRRLVRKRWHEIPHGDYGDVLAHAPGREESRARLDVDAEARLVMTVGALRAYKGVDELLDAFADMLDRRAVLLLSGQAPGAATGRRLMHRAGADPRVRLKLGFVDSDELHTALAAADLVVLPYRRVLNSGSALLALSARRRVLLPSTPTFEELSARVGPGWVHTYTGHLAAPHLERALSDPPPDQPPELAWCSWHHVPALLRDLWSPLR